MGFERILIAVDSGPLAAHAAQIGAELASLVGAQVGLIHAVAAPLCHTPENALSAEKVIAQAIQEGERLLAGFHYCLALPQSTSDFIHVGHPATGIVETAKKWAADLIVIGSHGRGGFDRMLLGSVAEEVMRHAPCPVLVTRAKE